MEVKIVKNPDEKVYNRMRDAVEKAGFMCPCTPFRDPVKHPEAICCCEEFRHAMPDVEKGEKEIFCHCRLYKKIVIEDSEQK